MANINVTARVAPNFPAKVQGSGGVDVDKTNGVYTISLDLDQFSNQEGSILYRGPTSWVALLRGQSGQVLRSTATSIEWGTSSADQTFVGTPPINVNTVGSTTTTSIDLDFYSANQGALITRNGSGWIGLDKGTTGQVLKTGASGNLEWDDEASAPTAPTYQIFTTPGSATWTRPAGCIAVDVEVVGGGGGAGGSPQASAGQAASSGGGAAGGYSRRYRIDVTAQPTVSVNVGAGGSGGDGATPSGGGTGGTSNFGAFVTCVGGGGSIAGNLTGATTGNNGGTGGAASGGDVNSPGNAGAIALSTAAVSVPGNGGAGPWGGGGRARSTGAQINGLDAGNYGAGGAGSGTGGASTAPADGGSGSPGIVIVTEHYF